MERSLKAVLDISRRSKVRCSPACDAVTLCVAVMLWASVNFNNKAGNVQPTNITKKFAPVIRTSIPNVKADKYEKNRWLCMAIKFIMQLNIKFSLAWLYVVTATLARSSEAEPKCYLSIFIHSGFYSSNKI